MKTSKNFAPFALPIPGRESDEPLHLGQSFSMEEIWKDIPNSDFSAQVSNIGRIRSFGKKRSIVPKYGWLHKSGYLNVRVIVLGKRISIGIHQLIARLFIPNPENKREVNHINGIKTDNRVENLEWVTPSENRAHALKNKLCIMPKGENNYASKLTEKQVIEIRNSFKGDKGEQSKMAEKYGVSVSAINLILKRKKWKHI